MAATTTEVPTDEPPPESRSVAKRRPARRLPGLPSFVARLCFGAAAVLLLHVIFPGVFWLWVLVDIYSTVFLPIDGGSLGVVVGLLIVGGALARRKRIGWTIAVVVGVLVLLGDLLTIVTVVATSLQGGVPFVDLATLARAAFNLATVGSLLAFLIVYRGEFSARRTPGNVTKALLTLAIGLAVTFGVGFLLTTLFPNDLAGPRGRMGWLATRILDAVLGESSGLARAGPPGWIDTVVGAAHRHHAARGATRAAAVPAAGGLDGGGRRTAGARAGRPVECGFARLLQHPAGQVGGLLRDRSGGSQLPRGPRRLPGQQ